MCCGESKEGEDVKGEKGLKCIWINMYVNCDILIKLLLEKEEQTPKEYRETSSRQVC